LKSPIPLPPRAQLRCKIVGRTFHLGDIMKRIPALVLLAALSFAGSMHAKAQIFRGPDSERQAQKAAKKQQKALNKAAKKQQKKSTKAAKKQQKAIKKYEKAQQKSARKTQRRV